MSKYKILDIRDASDSKSGKVLLVKANIITESDWGTMSFTPYVCNDTVFFFFPMNMLQRMVRIAQTEEFWEADMSEFIQKNIFDEDMKMMRKVFRHNSLY